MSAVTFKDLVRAAGEALDPAGSGRSRQRALAERMNASTSAVHTWWLGRGEPRGAAGQATRDVLEGIVRRATWRSPDDPPPSDGFVRTWLAVTPEGPVRRLGLLAWLCEEMDRLGDPRPFAVGGLVVEAFTRANYMTRDIDLKARLASLGPLLSRLGFEEGAHANVWHHRDLDLHVDWRGHGWDSSSENEALATNIPTPLGRAQVVGIEDIIEDRLAAGVAFKDTESTRWARDLLLIAQETGIALDIVYLQDKATRDGISDEMSRFLDEMGLVARQGDDEWPAP